MRTWVPSVIGGGLGDPDGADVGAVGGAEVLDEPLVAGGGDPGVPGGDVVVVELDRRVVAAADQDRRLGQAGGGAGVAALGDDDLGGRAAPLGGRLLLGRLAADAARGLGHPGAEHVGADHRDRGQHEDPQDREVGDPDQEERELRHRPPSSTIRTTSVVWPTWTREPLCRVARGTLRPSTWMPLVDPMSCTSINGSAVALRHHRELGVRPADPGVVDPQAGLAAATDHQPGRLQRVAGAVDLEYGARPAYLRVGAVRAHRGLRLAADPEPAGGQVVGRLERDLHRAGEHVALRVGVVLQLLGELAGQRGVVRRQPVEVDLRQLDVEVVGHQPPVAGQDLRVVVALPLQGGGDLDGLHGTAERAGEDAGDQLLQPLLEALQAAHVPPPWSGSVHDSVHANTPGQRRDRCDRIGAPSAVLAPSGGGRPPVWG